MQPTCFIGVDNYFCSTLYVFRQCKTIYEVFLCDHKKQENFDPCVFLKQISEYIYSHYSNLSNDKDWQCVGLYLWLYRFIRKQLINFTPVVLYKVLNQRLFLPSSSSSGFLSVTKSEQKKEHLQKTSTQAKKIQHLHERQFCTEVRYVVAFATYCLFKER